MTTLPVGFQETLVTKGVNPTGEDFAPDGRLFVANKQGTVSIVEPDGTLAANPFFSVDVDTYRDRGLISVLVDPDYVQNHYVYVYYTAAVPSNPNVADNGAVTKLVRLTASSTNPDVADPTSAVTILDNIPSLTGIHQGGFLHFGADGMLYVGVGEGDVKANAQDLSNIYGKMLRLDVHNYPNIIPPDNPFVGQAGKDPEIWAYGFHNPFSGGIVPGTNTVFVNDVGDSTSEEVDVLSKGGNYGWPLAEGPSTNPAFINPLFAYPHNGAGAAIVGGAFYNGGSFPASYSGQYFAADLIQGDIRLIDPVTGQGSVWATGLKLPTDLDVGPDGSLYWTSIGQGAIYKISYIGGTNHAPTAVATADVTSGPNPLTVNFDGTASSDADGDTLTYHWDFGDGTIATGAAASHTYTVNGVYTAVLTVSDRPLGGLSSSSAPMSITVGDTLPIPTITLPTAGTTFRGGDTIQFSGSATDAEDGPLDASAFTWSVLLLDDGSVLPYLGPFQGVTSGSFQIPTTGIDSDQSFRISLTVTDSAGFSSTTFVDLHPVLSTITLATNIAGVPLQLDGQPVASGTANGSVVGITHTIAAPPIQFIGGVRYVFTRWSDGGNATHDISTADSPATYTANYQAMPLAALYSSRAPIHAKAGKAIIYQVTITNVGTQTWRAGGPSRVQLGVYFGHASDAVGAWTRLPVRFSLPHAVPPGASVTLKIRIVAPTRHGTFVLRERMVKGASNWFDTMNRTSITIS